MAHQGYVYLYCSRGYGNTRKTDSCACDHFVSYVNIPSSTATIPLQEQDASSSERRRGLCGLPRFPQC